MGKELSDTEQSLSNTNTADGDFDAITRAILDGDDDALSRLMAAEGEQSKEEEETDDTSDTEENDDNPDDESAVKDDDSTDTSTKDDTPDDGDDNEAATSAASTDQKPEDIEAIKRELHQYKSDAGRVPYLQRRMAELDRELRAYKARDVAPTQKGNTTATSPDVELDEETKREIEELREIDPVMAKTLERIAKTAIASANSKVDHAVNTLTQSEQEAEDFRFFTEQKTRLLEAVPQADQIFATPEWQKWKETLTPGRRALAESSHADEVIQAIYAFAADMRALQGTPAPADTQVTPAATPENTEAVETRKRKLEATAEARNPSAKKAVQFDEEQAFREIYRQVAKDNHIL